MTFTMVWPWTLVRSNIYFCPNYNLTENQERVTLSLSLAVSAIAMLLGQRGQRSRSYIVWNCQNRYLPINTSGVSMHARMTAILFSYLNCFFFHYENNVATLCYCFSEQQFEVQFWRHGILRLWRYIDTWRKLGADS